MYIDKSVCCVNRIRMVCYTDGTLDAMSYFKAVMRALKAILWITYHIFCLYYYAM